MYGIADDTPTQYYRAAERRPGKRVPEISLRLRETNRAGQPPEDDTVRVNAPRREPRPDQRMLWVDGVGGYLVALADELTIGQPASDGDGPDLTVLADLSRRHARLSRTGGRYVLTPYADCWVGDRKIEGPAVLDDGARFSLGGVEFALRRPHALSATAVLTLTSGHRTVPAADAVLLMAESCVLGPKAHSHIRSADWREEAILFRSGGGLAIRSGGPLTVGDEPVSQPAELWPGIRVAGQDFAIAVEQVSEA